jgi:hypothetical protein
LSAFQLELLRAFARGAGDGFVLTAGAALAGFRTRHRSTEDLDFLTHRREALAEGEGLLREVAAALGASVESVPLESPSGPERERRLFFVRRDSEVTKVDLLCRSSRGRRPAEMVDDIAIDSALQIMADKLMVLDYRPRDLKDMRALEGHGVSLDDAVDLARAQIGISPRELMTHVSQLKLAPDMPHVGDDFAELEAYRRDLVARLARMAFPRSR